MRYLVTGGAGFIGSHLVEHLVAEGQEVVVLDDFSTGRPDNLAAVRDRIQVVEGSVTDLDTCRAVTRDVDFVLHQAALTSVTRSLHEPTVAHHVNVTGTINVLLAARDARVRRVIFAGSTAAYGDAAELPNREDTLPRPLSPYAAAKLAAEAYCGAFLAAYGLETVILRYFNVFGPRQDPMSPYAAAIPRFILAALRRTAPVIYGDGNQTRDFIFVTNVVHANLLACHAPAARVAGQVFNVACGQQVSINELWRRIQDVVGVRLPARHAEPRPGEVRNSLASIERARAELGYAPRVEFEEALRRTVSFYRGWVAVADRHAVPVPHRSSQVPAGEA
jgi:nucleoside-diphosphate-sugar epimerase